MDYQKTALKLARTQLVQAIQKLKARPVSIEATAEAITLMRDAMQSIAAASSDKADESFEEHGR